MFVFLSASNRLINFEKKIKHFISVSTHFIIYNTIIDIDRCFNIRFNKTFSKWNRLELTGLTTHE